MPLPLLLIAIAAASGAFGAGHTIDGISKSKKAKNRNEEAKKTFEDAANNLKRSKSVTLTQLESLGRKKLQVYDKSIGGFVRVFEQLKNVDVSSFEAEKYKLPPITDKSISEMKVASVNAGSIVAAGLTGISAGALAGVAAYGGATLLASASTGTAISLLSGIAAQNATLAWFGGGSLAAQGAGIAGGKLVLGGLVAGPALLVTGLIFGEKARKAYAEAQANLAKAKVEARKMQIACGMLATISETAFEIKHELNQLETVLNGRVMNLQGIIDVSGSDYRTYTKKERETVHIAVLSAQLVRNYLDVKILRKDGKFASSSNTILAKLKRTQKEISA